MPSRRSLLTTAGSALSAGFAGCLNSSYDDTANAAGDATDWPMAAHDRQHTRYIPDGPAPTDGVTERWSVPTGLASAPSVVAGDTVFATLGADVVAFDAETGEQRWSVTPDNGSASYWASPAVADDIAYIAGDEQVRAFDVESGEKLWSRSFGEPTTASPTLGLDDRGVFVAAGETVFRLDSETGETEWKRELFGRIRQSIAVAPTFAVVVSNGGDVYALSADNGTGFWQTALPSRSECVPTIAGQTTYIGCFDGRVYAINDLGEVAWHTEIGGFAKGGLGVADGTVYADGGRRLHALSTDGGEKQWHVGIGTIGDHPPVIVDDTVYVGGDRLRALKPGGGVGIGGARLEAARFTADLGGSVGSIAAADGSLYAHVGPGEDDDESRLVRLDPA